MPLSLLPYILGFCRVAIALVFAISFVGKASDVPAFQRAVAKFGLLPESSSKVAALFFLVGEATVVIFAALGGRFLGPGFLLAASLLLVFSAALVSVLSRRMRTPCNCFGLSQKPVSSVDVWRNVGLMAGALIGLGSLAALDRSQSSLGMAEWTLVGLMGTVFALVWIHLDEIVQLLGRA
jgi:hypothetical protein